MATTHDIPISIQSLNQKRSVDQARSRYLDTGSAKRTTIGN